MFQAVINKALLDECPFMENHTRRCMLGTETDQATGIRFRRKCRETDHESCVRFMTTMLFKSGSRSRIYPEFAEK